MTVVLYCTIHWQGNLIWIQSIHFCTCEPQKCVVCDGSESTSPFLPRRTLVSVIITRQAGVLEGNFQFVSFFLVAFLHCLRSFKTREKKKKAERSTTSYERCRGRFCAWGIIFPNIFLRVRWDIDYILTNWTTSSPPALPAVKTWLF